MSEFFEVAKVSELSPGEKKLVEVDDIPVALFNVNGEFFAIEDVCTHDGGPLAEGELDGDQIECPRHGARFNVCTGAALCMPATEPVECYEVKVEGDGILVSVDY
jgi:3-phenylpropionate/trans-cinnamate dioxygenase ferredoxin subunit